MASDRQSARNRENFYIAFIFRRNFVRIINFRKKSLSELIVNGTDTCLVKFLAFLTKFLSAEVTKFARFCKQKPWREKTVMSVGVYRGIKDH